MRTLKSFCDQFGESAIQGQGSIEDQLKDGLVDRVRTSHGHRSEGVRSGVGRDPRTFHVRRAEDPPRPSMGTFTCRELEPRVMNRVSGMETGGNEVSQRVFIIGTVMRAGVRVGVSDGKERSCTCDTSVPRRAVIGRTMQDHECLEGLEGGVLKGEGTFRP